jgi:hypothetical protein
VRAVTNRIAPIERQLGFRWLDVSRWRSHHQAVLSADRWPDAVAMPAFGPRMVYTMCQTIGADTRPNWNEQLASGWGLPVAFNVGIVAGVSVFRSRARYAW